MFKKHAALIHGLCIDSRSEREMHQQVGWVNRTLIPFLHTVVSYVRKVVAMLAWG